MKTEKHWLNKFTQVLRDNIPSDGVNRLQGDLNADTIICAPAVTEDEIDENLSWCSQVAQIFFGMLQGIGFNHNEFLIVPLTFVKAKPAKGNTNFSRVIVEAAARREHVKRFVCIGGDSFKFLFGSGKKPSMQTLIGSIIKLKQLAYKPLFIFPSAEYLDANLIRFAQTKRDEFIAKARYRDEMERFERLMPKFKLFMEEV